MTNHRAASLPDSATAEIFLQQCCNCNTNAVTKKQTQETEKRRRLSRGEITKAATLRRIAQCVTIVHNEPGIHVAAVVRTTRRNALGLAPALSRYTGWAKSGTTLFDAL